MNNKYVKTDQSTPQTPEKEFLNLFSDGEAEEERKNKPPPSQRIAFDKMKVKMVRESENIAEKDDQASILKFTKTASQKNLAPKADHEFLVIKSDKKVTVDEQTQQVRSLKQQIKQVEKFNEKIKQENLQLRLQKIKMSSDSDTMQILSLKMEIKELKKKIELLETQKREELRRQNQEESRKKNFPLPSKEYKPIKNQGFSFKNSFGNKNIPPLQTNDKARHSNLSNFGLSHAKSSDKLVCSEQQPPQTPTTTNLYNSQLRQQPPKQPPQPLHRNDGYKSPQPKKYYRK